MGSLRCDVNQVGLELAGKGLGFSIGNTVEFKAWILSYCVEGDVM
jgi:hypothetical protein